ncbi:hypothetical protein GGI04_003622 [Coemansia thaxteri]|nr:hypothetical protein GGI04_003622 [Coemansia thaxteri]KAJ2469386.1 hypothetical protein GGI02_003406 [Coemansia sp. RSA 2322]KAJ2478015.1 hypothetical protein EV174_004439 [Coemansia sp. RSA 2320]
MTPQPVQHRATTAAAATTLTPPPPLAEAPSGGEELQRTPHQQRVRAQTPQSAPVQSSRTHMLLTSPAAARRSRESLEVLRVAQTLKAGLARLKARADPQHAESAQRAQRAFSATSPAPTAQRQLLARHHSSVSPSSSVPRQVFSCPQRKLPARMPQPQLFPAPRFSLERTQSAASSTAHSPPPPPPPQGNCPKRAYKEIAEAAETMILFMRDSPTHAATRLPPPSSPPPLIKRPRTASSSPPSAAAAATLPPKRLNVEHYGSA